MVEKEPKPVITNIPRTDAEIYAALTIEIARATAGGVVDITLNGNIAPMVEKKQELERKLGIRTQSAE